MEERSAQYEILYHIFNKLVDQKMLFVTKKDITFLILLFILRYNNKAEKISKKEKISTR